MSPTPLKSETPDWSAEPSFEPAVFAPPGIDGEALYFAFRGDRLLVRRAGGRAEVPRLTSFAEAGVETQASPGEPADAGGPGQGGSTGAGERSDRSRAEARDAQSRGQEAREADAGGAEPMDSGGRNRVNSPGAGPEGALPQDADAGSPSEFPGAGAVPAEHYLGAIGQDHPGNHAGLPCFAVDLPDSAGAADGLSFKGLRNLFGLIDEELFAVAGRAFQVVQWDRTHRFCGRCGRATVHHERDRARQCPGCGLVSYPRVSPAVIVLVSRGDRFLLARNASFPGKRYSILAGFVEAGETLETAVVREIREEVGIEVRNVAYFGSQPWPFPHSLMVGFTAEHASGEIAIDGEEIVDAGWYRADPEQLPELPNRISISRRIIDSFLNAHGVYLP